MIQAAALSIAFLFNLLYVARMRKIPIIPLINCYALIILANTWLATSMYHQETPGNIIRTVVEIPNMNNIIRIPNNYTTIRKIEHIKLPPEMVLQRRLFNQSRLIHMCKQRGLPAEKIAKQKRIFNVIKAGL